MVPVLRAGTECGGLRRDSRKGVREKQVARGEDTGCDEREYSHHRIGSYGTPQAHIYGGISPSPSQLALALASHRESPPPQT
jgi:hypothetical protein